MRLFRASTTITLVVILAINGKAQMEVVAPAGTSVFNIVDFGARGDGKTLSTHSIQAAIDSADRSGGGTVIVPVGMFLTGTIVLKSNVTLFLENGGTLLGSPNLKDYTPFKMKPELEEAITGKTQPEDFGWLHLVYAERGTNLAIIGSGTIDGNGRTFWDDTYVPLKRPNQMIQFEGCEGITIAGVTIRQAPFWSLHFLSSKRIRVDGVTILNDRKGPNTDGIDINSSSEVFITNSFINVGDDAICLKSRFREEPVENILVSNCVLISDDSAFKLGTRSNGPIRHVSVSNCIIRESNYGISFFMKDGGIYSDLRFTDLTIETSTAPDRKRAVFPLFLDVEKRGPESGLGKIQDIAFTNIDIISTGHNLFLGQEESPIQRLLLQNIRMRVPGNDPLQAVVKPRGVRGLPAPDTDFGSIPSHFTFAHVNDVSLSNLRITEERERSGHHRSALWFVGATAVSIDNFDFYPMSAPAVPVLHFEQSEGMRVTNSRSPAGGSFLRLAGGQTREITLLGNDLRLSAKPFEISGDVPVTVLYQSMNRMP